MYLMTNNERRQDLLYFKTKNNNDKIKQNPSNKEEIVENIKVIVSILS